MANNKNIKINLDYSDFSGGITECQRKMNLLSEEFKMQQTALGNNASEVDKLSLAQQTLSQKIGLQVQVVEQAAAKFEALSRSEDASTAQVERAQSAYMKQITKLNQLSNELEDVNGKLDKASKEEESAGNSANKASNNFQNMSGAIGEAIMSTTAFITALINAGQELMNVARESTQWADDLVTLSAQMGVSTETLQELGYAANFVDVSVETMQSAMSKLTQEMANAQGGSTSAQQAFNNLGVSVTNADGSLKSAEQVFYEVIDALGNIDNAAERDAAAMEIFGRSAQELNSLIESGSDALQSYGEEARQLGIVMSDEDVQAIASMQDSFDRLDAVMAASGNRVSAAVAPAFSELADMLANLPQPVLDAASGIGKFWNVTKGTVDSVSQYIQVLSSLRMAKALTTMTTMGETEAEFGLAAAAGTADLALAPQIIVVGILAAAIVALVLAIKDLVDAYNALADATDKATASTQDFADASSGAGSSGSTGSTANTGSKHYALGGRVSGRRVWVGEQGAELVELPSGSTVYNHQESSNMSSSNNYFNVTIDAKNVNDFNKVVNVFSGLSQSMNRGGKVNG